MRRAGDEKYIAAINPSGRKTEAVFASLRAHSFACVAGNNPKCSFKLNRKGFDIIQLAPVSAVVYKVD